MELTASSVFASLIWGTIGFGLCLYGKKQRSIFPFCGGFVLIALSYLVGSALYLSLASIGVIGGIYFFTRD